MILRRITEHVKSQNWFAVGIDFVIVVIGVFVGLRVQEWSVKQADRKAERSTMERHHGEELILGVTYEFLSWPNVDRHVRPIRA